MIIVSFLRSLHEKYLKIKCLFLWCKTIYRFFRKKNWCFEEKEKKSEQFCFAANLKHHLFDHLKYDGSLRLPGFVWSRLYSYNKCHFGCYFMNENKPLRNRVKVRADNFIFILFFWQSKESTFRLKIQVKSGKIWNLHKGNITLSISRV